MRSCDSPFTPISLSKMHRTQSHGGKAKLLKRKKGFLSSVKGISHLSRRAKRRRCCKLQLWMWRKQRENCRFRIFRLKKRACGNSSSPRLSVKTQSQENKTKNPTYHTPNLMKSGRTPALGCDTMPAATMPTQKSEPLVQPSEITHPLRLSHTVKPLSTDRDACGLTTHFKEPRTPAQKLEVSGPACQSQAPNSKKTSQTDVNLLTNDIHEFLDGFYRIYGSFIPLQKGDVFRHLKRKFNTDFSDRKNIIFSEVFRHRAAITQKPVPSFQVVYKKHTLTLDDLSTLADQNWLNDQVMNMYGDLIMESAHHKVHFLNSFFHKQLMTKGYEGVKRWTKQVDLFSKRLLLVPVHLEVHWCLVTADISKKKICLYDSQGNALQKVARNVLKYLMTEAKEKKQTHFLSGWAVSFNEIIPQQTNENDCGVFVLEYSRCLALEKPLQFSQKDIPKIRKRIYKELCDCKLHEQG